MPPRALLLLTAGAAAITAGHLVTSFPGEYRQMTHQAEAPLRYSTAAIWLHWLLAGLLAFQLALGWRLEDLAKGSAQFAGFQLHKSVGIAILLLSIARLAICILRPKPSPVPGSVATTLLAKAVHALLYVVMIGGPLSGWVLVSTARVKLQTMLFGVVPWPSLPLGAGWHEPAEGVHSALALVLVAAFVLHVAGALWHHYQREDVIGRMLPAGIASHRAIGLAALFAILAIAASFVAARVWSFGSPIANAAPASVAAAPGVVEAASAASEPAPASSDPAPGASAAAATEAATASPSPSATAEIAKASSWQVESGGRLGFRADYSGSAVDGTFQRWDADIVFSPEDLANSRIRVDVDLGSANTADSERDDMLRSASFFDVAAHPRATFTVSRITPRGPGRYLAAGTLSLHGQSRQISVPFTLSITGNRATVAGSAQLNRTAFGVGSGEWAGTDQIRDGVAISFRFNARRK